MPVSVIRITVQYAHEGRLFELEFKPAAMQSIVFDRTDLDRALLAQRIAVKTALQTEVPAADPFPLQDVGSIRSVGAASAGDDGGPEIWWHSGCRWTHPDT